MIEKALRYLQNPEENVWNIENLIQDMTERMQENKNFKNVYPKYINRLKESIMYF